MIHSGNHSLVSVALILLAALFASTPVAVGAAGAPSPILVDYPPDALHHGPTSPSVLLAAAAGSHIARGNSLRGAQALAEYRLAVATLRRYVRAGGSAQYETSTLLSVARGFWERSAVADARRTWALAAGNGSWKGPGSDELESATVLAERARYADAVRPLAAGYSIEMRGAQYLSTASLSSSEGSPDLQFDRGIAACAAGDLAGAERWFSAAARFDPSFADAHFALGVILLARGHRSDAFRELLDASTVEEGFNTPQVRSYGSGQGVRAARILLSLTAR